MELPDPTSAILNCRLAPRDQEVLERVRRDLESRAGIPVSKSAAVRFLIHAGSVAVADGRHVALAAPAGVASPR